MSQSLCDCCRLVTIPVPNTYCDKCVEDIVAWLEQEELKRVAEVSALFDRNYDLEYQRRYQDGLGFSY